MKIRHAMAVFAFLAMVAFVASTALAGPACSGQTKATSAGSSCSAKASADKASCGASCTKACCAGKTTSTHACNYTEEECTKYMREHYKSHGWLGIEMDMDSGQPVLTRVVENSPAAAAGFQVGDVLTSVNGIGFKPENEAAIQEFMKNGFKVGDIVVYTANRGGSIVSLRTTLAKISDQALAEMITSHNAASKHQPTEKAESIEK